MLPTYDSGLLYDSGVCWDTELPSPGITRKKMSKPKLNLSDYGFPETLVLATAIKTAMTGNANFTTPVPTLAAIGTMITDAQGTLDAYTASLADTEEKMSARDDAFTALRAGLTQLAGYVEAASGGDQTKIESAGMAVRAPRTPTQVPGQIMNLVLTEGDFPGTLDAAWDPDRFARLYETQTSPDPMTESSWASKATSTKSSKTLDGLASGAKVWVRVRANGAAGPGPWSDPATKTVP